MKRELTPEQVRKVRSDWNRQVGRLAMPEFIKFIYRKYTLPPYSLATWYKIVINQYPPAFDPDYKPRSCTYRGYPLRSIARYYPHTCPVCGMGVCAEYGKRYGMAMTAVEARRCCAEITRVPDRTGFHWGEKDRRESRDGINFKYINHFLSAERKRR